MASSEVMYLISRRLHINLLGFASWALPALISSLRRAAFIAATTFVLVESFQLGCLVQKQIKQNIRYSYYYVPGY
jgi:hypothetical protein